MTDNNSFQQFCGGTFWDTELTWGGDSPMFTECFQITIVCWVPCAFFWLLLTPYLYYLSTHQREPFSISVLFIFKLVIGSLMTVTTFCDVIKGVFDYNDGIRPLAYVVSPTILMITLITAVIIAFIEKVHNVASSGPLFFFYLLLIMTGIIPFYMKILESGYEGDLFRFVSFYIYYILLLVQFFLHCLSERVPQQRYFSGKDPSPELTATVLSNLTFWWVNRLMFKGYKKSLEETDTWAPNPDDMVQTTGTLFDESWKKEQQRKLQKRSHSKTENETYDITEKTKLLNDKDVKPQKKQSISLFKVLAKVYGPSLLNAYIFKFIYDLLIFVGPQLQSLLISYTQDSSTQEWKGYLYAVCFLILTTINSLFFNQNFFMSMRAGMRIKAALIAAVYKKALTMSNEARKTTTVGQIVTLMSVDCQRVQNVVSRLWLLGSAPMQAILSLYFLWGILGPSVIAGLAVMIVMIPLGGIIARFQRKLQIAQMKLKDSRIKLMSEILSGIKVLKLYAWELSYQDKVYAIREKEMALLKKYAYLQSLQAFTLFCAPFLVTITCFATYSLTGGILDANTAFVSLTLFNMLRFPINMLPQFISNVVVASVSVKRLGKYLQQPDIEEDVVQHKSNSECPLVIENGTFAWGTTDEDILALKSINVKIREGQLVAVVGQVGCGKSSLLSAFIGEMEKLQGVVNVKGSMAYVSQVAWIQNKTLRDNVIFGNDVEESWYDEVLEACALKPDLQMLPYTDMTEIGEKGINLSGGQKQRVALARAVYADTDIYLMDDPLSAVDSHVGKHIFEKVIGGKGLLKNKTRVLVTHGVHWLPRVDNIIVMVNGQISEVGSYEELLSHDGDFAQLLKTYLSMEDSNSDEDEEVKKEKIHILEQVSSVVSDNTKSQSITGKSVESTKKRSKRSKAASSKKSENKSITDKQKVHKMGQKKQNFRNVEKAALGKVKWAVFLHYISAIGMLRSFVAILVFLCYHGSTIGASIWLSVWSEDPLILNSSLADTPAYADKRDMYLGVYGALGLVQSTTIFFFILILALGLIKAAWNMHNKLLSNILRSAMSFFDTTPIGRVLNRFSGDTDIIDITLPGLIKPWMNNLFGLISTFIVITYSTPIFLAALVPIGLIYYIVQKFYIPTSRQLKRIESITKSPIYTHFNETLTGASTIRAFGLQSKFINRTENMVDHNLTFYYGGIIANRWLAFRLDFLGGLVVFSAAIFAVIGRDSLTGGLVGLSISYALQVTRNLSMLVRSTNDLEINIVAVERVKEYTETPNEAEWYIENSTPHRSWPDQGNVSLQSYSTRYRPQLDLVLQNINIDIKGGEKVGIVGRTGAGKSSLTLALFRILEAQEGNVTIDGVHINTLGLHQLRSKLTILPQDPVLFSGTIRTNLDPLNHHSDEQLWQALEHAHLKVYISSFPEGLEYECSEGGQNLSVGQRQLVCLARTLLQKTKILIFDEATAAVDLETDDLIQNTIRTDFADCTVITIAHRINTIMESDRIIVMDKGRVAEIDTPVNLLKDTTSIFYSMAKSSGLVE